MIEVSIISFQVVVNYFSVLMLTGLHGLQNGCQAPVQGREVWFRQEGGSACQRVLNQRLPHDITQTAGREGQQAQAKEGGPTDPT